MKGSVAEEYLNFESQYIYTYYRLIWEDILSFEKLNQSEKLWVVNKIKKQIISEKFCIDQTTDETLIIDNKAILENNKLFEIVLNIAIEINNYATNIKQNAKFHESLAKIKNKYKSIDYQEIIENLRPIEKILKKEFLAERKSSINFNKKINNEVFNLKFHPIYNLDWSIANMLETELRWNIEEIKGEHHDILSKILTKYNIDDELVLISLKEIDLFLIKSYINNKKVNNIFIDLTEKFLNKKSLIQKLKKILNEEFVKKSACFRVSYTVLEKCNSQISELKEEGYSFCLSENIDISKEQYNLLINYVFVHFDEISSDEKLLTRIDYCKNKKIKIIVNEVNDDIRAEFCKKNAGDFLKKT